MILTHPLTLPLQIPQDPPQPLGKHAQGKRKRSATAGARGKSESRGADDKALLAATQAVHVYNPEEGWDADTNPTGVVLDYVTKEEVSRRAFPFISLILVRCLLFTVHRLLTRYGICYKGIAYTAKMIDPKPAANNDWYFQKVFGDGEFIAAGQLRIPPRGRKPSKGTKDNTYVRWSRFYF
jgi:centromere protein C